MLVRVDEIGAFCYGLSHNRDTPPILASGVERQLREVGELDLAARGSMLRVPRPRPCPCCDGICQSFYAVEVLL